MNLIVTDIHIVSLIVRIDYNKFFYIQKFYFFISSASVYSTTKIPSTKKKTIPTLYLRIINQLSKTTTNPPSFLSPLSLAHLATPKGRVIVARLRACADLQCRMRARKREGRAMRCASINRVARGSGEQEEGAVSV